MRILRSSVSEFGQDFQNPAGYMIRLTHRKKIFWGVLFGCIYWLAASLLSVSAGSENKEIHISSLEPKVNYANTIYHKIKKAKASPEMGSGAGGFGNNTTQLPAQDNLRWVGGNRNSAPTRSEIEEYTRTVFGSDGDCWLARMWCESSLNPFALNSAGYAGLLQFSPRTFTAFGGVNIWDYKDQIDTAKRMVDELGKEGAEKHWSCK